MPLPRYRTDILQPPASRDWTPRHTWLLGALALAGLAWRLHVALSAPWYFDEGYVAELVQSLARAPFSRPHIGALWEDGFLPLSASLLAPYSAVPFVLPRFWSAMTGVRLWAVALDMASLGLLVLLVRPRENPRLALLTAGAYALLPFAAEFGGRAFYHHFSVALMLACLVLGRGLFEEEGLSSQRVAGASLCAGLAVGGCYWLWWFGVLWCLALAWKRPLGWAWGWFWAGLPVLAVLALDILPDPQGAWWSVRGLLKMASTNTPRALSDWASAFQDLAALPFLGVGLLGLAWEAWRRRGPWPWFALCLACAVLEPMRQRGTGSGDFPYPFQIAAPLAALGAAALAFRLAREGRRAGLALAAAAGCLYLLPVNLSWIPALSYAPGDAAALRSFLSGAARPGDLVCGMPQFDWTLRPALRVCDPYELTAAEGLPTFFYPAGLPAARFAYPCRVRDARFCVTSAMHLWFVFHCQNVAGCFLEMEREGWPVVYSSPSFRVYENPRFGVRPDPRVRILQDKDDYLIARNEARAEGRPDLVALADERLRTAGGAAGGPRL